MMIVVPIAYCLSIEMYNWFKISKHSQKHLYRNEYNGYSDFDEYRRPKTYCMEIRFDNLIEQPSNFTRKGTESSNYGLMTN
jgi:hypothetical protein